jgi:DNA polymerase-3 subunit chi
LWTFSPTEFVAHCRAGSPAEQLIASPVVLAALVESAPELPHHQVLLNLGAEVAPGFERFERTIEVVSFVDEDRQKARQRWKHYADLGYAITRHDLKLRD